MQLGSADVAAGQPNVGNALQLAPAAGTELLSDPHDLSNPSAYRDCLDTPYGANDFKMHHRFSVPYPPRRDRSMSRRPIRLVSVDVLRGGEKPLVSSIHAILAALLPAAQPHGV